MSFSIHFLLLCLAPRTSRTDDTLALNDVVRGSLGAYGCLPNSLIGKILVEFAPTIQLISSGYGVDWAQYFEWCNGDVTPLFARFGLYQVHSIQAVRRANIRHFCSFYRNFRLMRRGVMGILRCESVEDRIWIERKEWVQLDNWSEGE